MKCAEAEEARLSAASGPLEPAAARELAAHVAACPRCAAFAADIDALEGRLAATLAEAGAAVDIAARFRDLPPRRAAPILRRALALAAAAVLVIAVGASIFLARPAASPAAVRLASGRASYLARPGTLEVRTPFGTIKAHNAAFFVEVLQPHRSQSMALDRRILAGGAVAAVAVGVTAGFVFLETPQGDAARVHAGQVGFADAHGRLTVEDLADLRRKAEAADRLPALAEALEQANARSADLERRLAAAEAAASGPTAAKNSSVSPLTLQDANIPCQEPNSRTSAGKSSGPDGPDAKLDAMIKAVDWSEATRAIVAWIKAEKAGRTSEVDPATFMALSRLNVATADMAKLLGLPSAEAVYADPRVMEAFLPAWLNALGADLDPAQAEALRAILRSQMAADRAAAESNAFGTSAAASTYVGRRVHDLRSEVEFEEGLGQLLRPEQHAHYLESVGDDPHFASEQQRKSFSASSEATLVRRVADAWIAAFELSERARPAAESAAARFVAAALAVPPVPPGLDPAARRLATMRRELRVLEIQVQAEAVLASDGSLTDEERARAAKGAPFLLEVKLE